jgi:polysaccharide deacetylase 2 family uncharacterized protein YibQ
MFWPGTSEILVNIPIVGRLSKEIQFLVSLSVLLFLLSSGTLVVSGEISESSSTEVIPSTQSESASEETTDTEFMFEEPSLDGNGHNPSIILPEPDECLELPEDLSELPRIAIIIDDMGHHQKMGGELLDLDLNLTFSFLPQAPFTQEQEERAWKLGRDILVHMPMEPQDLTFDPGPGALYVDASVESIFDTVEDNLTYVPHAIGVNNHMGSKFTADRQAMHEVLSVMQKKGLFFVDSVTVSGSLGADEARRMGMKTGSRHVFLDNSQTQEDICRQLKRLVAYAKKHGTGIGIGHPNRATINALKMCQELLLKQVEIVGIHELVN